MKHNVLSVFTTIAEWVFLIAPTAGYAIYCYRDTLQYTMSATSKGCFWSLIAIAVLAMVLYGIFRKRYDRYVQGFVQQKTDLETKPDDELLVKKVAEKKSIIENVDYVAALFPVLIALTVLYAFQTAIEQLVVLLIVVAGSLAAKICLHTLTIAVQKKAMLPKKNKEADET